MIKIFAIFPDRGATQRFRENRHSAKCENLGHPWPCSHKNRFVGIAPLTGKMSGTPSGA